MDEYTEKFHHLVAMNDISKQRIIVAYYVHVLIIYASRFVNSFIFLVHEAYQCMKQLKSIMRGKQVAGPSFNWANRGLICNENRRTGDVQSSTGYCDQYAVG